MEPHVSSVFAPKDVPPNVDALAAFRSSEARTPLSRRLSHDLGASQRFVFVKSAPEVASSEVELAHVQSIEVVIAWGDNVLHVAHLTPPRSFFVGDARGSDFVIPREKLGAPLLQLLRVEGDAVTLAIPASARGHVQRPGEPQRSLDELRSVLPQETLGETTLRAPSGLCAELTIGDLTFFIALVSAGKPVPRGLGSAFDKVAASYFGGALFTQAALIAALASFTPPLGLSDSEELDRERMFLMEQYLSASAERERPEEAPSPQAVTSERDGGTGERAALAEGQMGLTTTRQQNRRWAAQGKKDNFDPHLARERALAEAKNFGLIGMLRGGVGDPLAPTSPFGRDASLGSDALSAQGNMWGDEIGEAFGAGGLGLMSYGLGGGGKGIGVGLGELALGHGAGLGQGDGFGNGVGRLGARGHRPKTPSIRTAMTVTSGRLPAEVIQRVVRQNHGRFRFCYEQGLTRNPNLEGRIEARFVIGRDGAVSNVSSGASDLPDAAVKSCVLSAFYGLSFPAPESGVVTVSYPIAFTPGR